MEILRERDVEFDVIQYLKNPIDAATMARLIDLVGDPPAEFIRKDRNFKALGLNAADYTTRDAVVGLLQEHPKLMQRPIVVRGEKAVIARPSEKVEELL